MGVDGETGIGARGARTSTAQAGAFLLYSGHECPIYSTEGNGAMKFRAAARLMAVGLLLSSGVLASSGGVTLVDDALRGVESQTLVADGEGPLSGLTHQIRIAVPDLGDAPTTIALPLSMSINRASVKGRLITIVFRVRGEDRKRLGRTQSPISEWQFDPSTSFASHSLDLASDELQAGDVLEVEFSFSGNSTIGAGDRIRLGVRWEAIYMGTMPFRAGDSSTTSYRSAGELTLVDHASGWVRAERTMLEDKPRLASVVRDLEIPIPDLSNSAAAETLDVFYSSRVLSILDDGLQDPALGRLQARVFLFRAGAGARQLLARATVRMRNFNSGGVATMPIPDGLGLGDRVVVRISYKTDWKVKNPDGAEAVLVAQLILRESSSAEPWRRGS